MCLDGRLHSFNCIFTIIAIFCFLFPRYHYFCFSIFFTINIQTFGFIRLTFSQHSCWSYLCVCLSSSSSFSCSWCVMLIGRRWMSDISVQLIINQGCRTGVSRTTFRIWIFYHGLRAIREASRQIGRLTSSYNEHSLSRTLHDRSLVSDTVSVRNGEVQSKTCDLAS